MEIPILYEDKDVVVINKPAGLIVHSDGKTSIQRKGRKEKSLVDWILKKYPNIKNVGEPMVLNQESRIKNKESIHNSKFIIHNSIILRPGIVHRIDKDTTGALIIAKNKKSYEFLKKQFQEKKVHKVYHAFVYGELKEDRGIIDRPIGRSPKDFRKWSAQRGKRGEVREAITYFKVLKRIDGITFIEAIPKTGRTHQIRVHLKAIDHPIVHDELYAPKFFLDKKNQLGFKRIALHARILEITLPSGKLLNIVAPYPKDFEKAVKKLIVKK